MAPDPLELPAPEEWALADIAADGRAGPLMPTYYFAAALTERAQNLAGLRFLCSPGGDRYWGDYAEAARLLSGWAMRSTYRVSQDPSTGERVAWVPFERADLASGAAAWRGVPSEITPELCVQLIWDAEGDRWLIDALVGPDSGPPSGPP